MPADPSIYGLLQPPANPLDSYGKALNLRALMTQNRVGELQAQDTEQNLNEKNAFREGLKGLAPGELESAIPRLMSVAPTQALALQQQLLQQRQLTGSIKHTEAQTGEITAGHIAGAWAALAKGGGSDESVKAAHDMMSPLVGEERASQVTQQLLSMPPETRLAYAVAQAGQHKTGQEALKLFFPQAHMQDTGGQITPVTTSTLPGSPAPGTPIPGGAVLPKTQSPDSVASQQTAREGHAITERGQNMVDSRTRELNGIMEGSLNAPSPALVKAIASGEIELKPPPTNARNPVMLQRYGQILEQVKAENPNWSQEMYPTIKKTIGAFAAGKEAQTVKSLNTATDHVETLRELSSALKNGNVQLFNRLSNQWASNTGNPAPSNLSVAAQVIGGEIVKGIVGAGGGTGERERAEAAFSNVKSPADMEGAINTVTKLMGGQFKGMQKQYEAGTYGRKDFSEKYLTPAAQKALEAAQGGGAPKQEAATSPKPGKLVPAKGAVQDGYRFKGGDPSKAESWEKV